MEWLNIEELHPNPNNEHHLSDKGKELLLHAMSLGDHGLFLTTPDKMIINGNNRWHLRIEAGWDTRFVLCRYLTYGQDAEGYYAIIDEKVIKEHEVIPHHYVSVEALYAAYAFSANGEAGYYERSVIDKFPEWGLDPAKFVGDFFPPKSFAESLEKLKAHEKKKKYEIVIACQDEEDMDSKYSQVLGMGMQARRKI
jgi:hypothetical protein